MKGGTAARSVLPLSLRRPRRGRILEGAARPLLPG